MKDYDYDGYDSQRFITWDADTDVEWLEVKVVIYAIDEYNQTYLLGFTPYWLHWDIAGDSNFFSFDVPPHRGTWNFRLALVDEYGDTLDTHKSGEYLPGGGILENRKMEYRQEDALFVDITADPPDHGGWINSDEDEDGYDDLVILYFKVRLRYDSTYWITAAVFAKDAANHEVFIGESNPAEIDPDSTDYQVRGFVVGPFPFVHGEWDFRMELYAVDCGIYHCPLTSVPYDSASGWMNVQGERWNEDGHLTTVFKPTPIHSLNEPQLWDEDDALNAVPMGQSAGAYYAVSLSRLDDPVGGIRSLTGDYVSIVDFPQGYFAPAINDTFGKPYIAPPTSTDGSFPYLRDQPGFEAVMCYYYIDANQEYIQELGFNSACNRPIQVDAHAWYNTDDATYVADPDSYGFGPIVFGDGGTDAGEDADVILHEYFHAVADNVTRGIFFGKGEPIIWNETKAMAEGSSDYWACSWVDSFYASPFPSAYEAEWDARYSQGANPYRRRVDTYKVYPDDMRHPIDPNFDDP